MEDGLLKKDRIYQLVDDSDACAYNNACGDAMARQITIQLERGKLRTMWFGPVVSEETLLCAIDVVLNTLLEAGDVISQLLAVAEPDEKIVKGTIITCGLSQVLAKARTSSDRSMVTMEHCTTGLSA